MYHGEKFNSVTQLVGSALSIAGLSILVTLAAQQGDPWKVLSFSIYGVTLVMLYCFSTIFHSIRSPRAKAILQKLDHNAIYLLIAGSYTPIALITLRGPWGWTLFGLSWCLALFGIVQELTLGRHTRRLSMILYVLMGWLVLIAIKPLTQAMPPGGMGWPGRATCFSSVSTRALGTALPLTMARFWAITARGRTRVAATSVRARRGDRFMRGRAFQRSGLRYPPGLDGSPCAARADFQSSSGVRASMARAWMPIGMRAANES